MTYRYSPKVLLWWKKFTSFLRTQKNLETSFQQQIYKNNESAPKGFDSVIKTEKRPHVVRINVFHDPRFIKAFKYGSVSATVGVALVSLAIFITPLFAPKPTLSASNHGSQFRGTDVPSFALDTAGLVKVRKGLRGVGALSDGGESVSAIVVRGDEIQGNIKPEITTDPTSTSKFDVKLLNEATLKPGKYTLKVTIKKAPSLMQNLIVQNITQDFTWGVLAINPDKANYNVGETASLAMAVLSDDGNVDCSAKISLSVTDPTGYIKVLSTEDKSIAVSDTCNAHKLGVAPDFLASYKVDYAGNYVLNLHAETFKGTHDITDGFTADSGVGFDITRDAPTRIYPPLYYPTKITVKASTAFTGVIQETVPASFAVKSGDFAVTQTGDKKTLTWPASLAVGEVKTLEYEWKAPDISPEFYVVGPLKFIDKSGREAFVEGRQWQVAADTVYTCTPTGVSPTTWTTAANWTGCNGGYPGQNITDGTNQYDVAINNAATWQVNVNATPTYSIRALTVGAANAFARTLSFTGAYTLTTTGLVTVTGPSSALTNTISIGSGGILNAGAGLNVTAGTVAGYNSTVSVGVTATSVGTLNVTGNITLSGTGTATLSTLYTGSNVTMAGGTFSGAQTVSFVAGSTFSTTGASTVSGAYTFGGNLTQTSGTLAITGATTVTGTMTVTAGTCTVGGVALTANGVTNVSGTLTASSAVGAKNFAGLVTVASGGVFDLYTASAYANASTFGAGITNNSNVANSFRTGSGTITFSASQNLSGTGTGGINIAGASSISAGFVVTNNTSSQAVTFGSVAGGAITCGSATSGITTTGGSDTIFMSTAANTCSAGVLTPAATANTIEYNYAGAQTLKVNTTNPYWHLILGGSGAKTWVAGITALSGNLTINGTTTSTTMVAALTVSGNLAINASGAGGLTTAGFTFQVNGTTAIAAGTSTLSLANITGTKTLTGLVTLNGGTLSSGGTATPITLGAGITNTSGTVNITGAVTMSTLNGALTSTAAMSITTLTMNTATAFTTSGAGGLTVATFTATSPAVVTNTGLVTVSTSLTGTGNFTNGANGTLNLNFTGTPGITALTTTATGNTVSYGFAGTQNIFTTTYYNLTLANSGIKTALAGLTVNNTFTMSGTAALTTGAYTDNFYGSWVVNTTVATPLVATGSTINFQIPGTPAATSITGTGTTTITFVTVNFNNTSGFSTSNSGAPTTVPISATGVATVATGVVVTNNGVTTFSSSLAGLGGFTNAATGTLNLNFTGAPGITTITASAAGNTVSYGFAGAQTVFPINYSNLTLANTTAKTLQASTTTIGGTLSLTGTASTSTVVGLAINGNLSIGNGTTFTAAGYNLTVTGTTTVGGGASGSLVISSSTGTKIFTGNVTTAAGSTWNNSGASPVTFRGGLTVNGSTFTAGAGIYTFDTTASQAIGGTLAIAIPSLTVTSPTVLTNNSTVGLTIATALAGNGNLTQAASSVLNLGGTSAVTTLAASNTGNTVTYNSTTAGQTINAITFYNLAIAKTAQTATLGGATVVNNDLTVTSGILGGSSNLTVIGNVTGGGTVTLTTPSVFIQQLAAAKNFGSNGGAADWTFYDLRFENTSAGALAVTTSNNAGGGKIISTGTLTVGNVGNTYNTTLENVTYDRYLTTNNVNITSKGLLTASDTNVFNVSGNWTNSGTFTHSSGTVTFTGAAASTQIVTGNTTFYNLVATAVSARTINFASGSTTTVTGRWTATGAVGQNITLGRDGGSGTNQWSINPTTWTVDYVTPTNSNNLASAAIAPVHYTDGGNNVKWFPNVAPNDPTTLVQQKTDNTVIMQNSWVNDNSVKFTALATDPNAIDTLQLCVEKDLLGVAFSGVEDSCGVGVAYSGSGVTTTLTMSGLAAGEYHWQGRIKDTAGAYSNWVVYGANTDPNDRDFATDITAPTTPTGVTVGVVTSSTVAISWTASTDGGSGLANPAYHIERAPDSAGSPGIYAEVGTSNIVTYGDSSLTPNVRYWYRIRAVDLASNFSFYSSENNNATGGTVTYTDSSGANPRTSPPYVGGYVVQTFTGTGSLVVSSGISNASVLVVAGGGGGGSGYGGGGGGAGGVLYGSQNLSGTMPVTVGSVVGGDSRGNNSVFGSQTAIGGGYGGNDSNSGGPGGSGGGGGAYDSNQLGGTGTAGQGYNGYGGDNNGDAGSGGGLAYQTSITGTLVTYGTGGTGGCDGCSGTINSGAANTGNGGDGGNNNDTGGGGGSGIVVIRYPYLTGANTSAITLTNVPTSPLATAASTTSINPITWAAPSVGTVDHYHVKSSLDSYATNIYDNTGTTTSQSSLSQNTLYTYHIYGVNLANVESATYATASATTLSAGINISGTSDLASGTVNVAINSTLQAGKTGTISGGTWTIAGVNPVIGDVITVWVEPGLNWSTAVTKYNGSGNETGLVLNLHALSIGSASNQSLTVANLGLIDRDQKSYILHTSNSGVLDLTGSYSDVLLSILSGNTLTIGGTETLNAINVNIAGTLSSSGNSSYNISGNWTRTGTFTASTSTTTFNGLTPQTISGTNTWNNLSISGGGADPNAAQTVNGTLAIVLGQWTPNTGDQYVNVDIQTGGTMQSDSGASISVSGNWTRTGTFSHNSGTVTFNGSGAQAITGTNTWNNLTINNTAAAPSDATDVDPNAVQTVSGNLTIVDGQWSPNNNDTYGNVDIQTNGILKPDPSAVVYILGNWSRAGTFTHNNSTVYFSGSTPQTITGTNTWYGLYVDNTAASPSDAVDVDPNLPQTVLNIMSVHWGQYSPNTGDSYNNVNVSVNGILKPDPGALVSVSGNWSNSGTFTHNGGTVTFNGSGAQSITGSNTWNNLTINNSAASPSDTYDVDPNVAQTVTGTLIVTDGQWTPNTGDSYANVNIGLNGIMKPDASASISISGNWANIVGTFTHNNSTVNLTGAGASTQVLTGNTTFYNLSATALAARTINFASGTTQTVAGTWSATGAAGQNLVLGRDGGSGSAQWNINPTSKSVDYVTPANSNNQAVSPVNPVHYTDGGNNTNWFGDTLAPVITSFAINSNAISTTNKVVTLSLTATDGGSGVSQMQFSNNGQIWSNYETFATSKTWDLTDILYGGTSDAGTKSVSVHVKDAAGNVASYTTASSNTPIADWQAMTQGNHYGNFYDNVSGTWATVSRAGVKTIYDPSANNIYDVPANYLGVNNRVDGKSGSEAMVEESKANLLIHSYFDSSGWYTGGSPQTKEYVTAPSIYGGYSLHMITNANNQTAQQNVTTAIGTTYTASVYTKVISGQPVLMALNNGVYSSAIAPSGWAGDNKWHQLTLTFTEGATAETIFLGKSNGGAVGEYYFGAVQLEAGGFATSYIPTTSSAVTRNADVVTVATTNWNASTGTAFVTAGDSAWRNSTVSAGGTWSWEGDSGQNFYAYDEYSNSYISQNWASRFALTPISAGYHVRAGEWNPGNPLLSFVDGNSGADSANDVVPTGMQATAMVGYYSWGGSYFDGPIQRLTMYSAALSGADVTTVTNAIKDGAGSIILVPTAPVIDTPTTPTNDITPVVSNAATPNSAFAGNRINLYDNGTKVASTVSDGSGVFTFGDNKLADPSFETDVNTPGTADSWYTWSTNYHGAITTQLVSAPAAGVIDGNKAQRLAYTSVAGDVDEDMQLMSYQISGFSPGDTVTASYYITGTLTGSTWVSPDIYAYNSNDTQIGSSQWAQVYPNSKITMYTKTFTIPAGTAYLRASIGIGGVDFATNDGFDITIDKAEITNYNQLLADGNHTNITTRSTGSNGMESTDSNATTILVDTVAPTVSANIAAINVTTSSIPLTWAASTDSTGVAGYEVQRAPDVSGLPGTWANISSGACAGLVSGLTCSDVGLSANSKYWYHVRAKDLAGNYSGYLDGVNATGGVVTYTDSSGLNPRSNPPYVGGYEVHTFTASGSVVPTRPGYVEALVVGGGGGGGGVSVNGYSGGGGGAGGVVQMTVPISAQSYSVTVGGGGTAGPTGGITNGGTGNNSSFSSLTALGGGGGGEDSASPNDGVSGASGGGGAGQYSNYGGTGTQGHDGGRGKQSSYNAGGGGGGFGSAGGTPVDSISGGIGGAGIASSISGSPLYYAGGGGGASSGTAGTGGSGVGGNGGLGSNGVDATANSGGGGGGGGGSNAAAAGGAGGSGIVIIRYLYSVPLAISTLANAPTSLTLSAASSTQVNMSWTAPAGGADHYHLYSSSNGYASPIYNATGVTTSESSLTPNTQYTYHLYAVNADNVESAMVGEENADANTVGLWHFNESSGTAADSSSFGSAATLYSSTFSTGKMGNALNDNNNYAQTAASPSAYDTGSTVTVETWFKTTTIQSGRFLVMHDDSSYKYGVYLTGTSNALSFYVRTTTGTTSAGYTLPAGNYADGAWHYLVATYDKNLGSNRLKLYVDGTQKGQSNGYAEDILPGDEGIGFGKWGSAYFTGFLDEVRISNNARTSTEIQNNYNETNPYPKSIYTLTNAPTLPTATAASSTSINPISWSAPAVGTVSLYHVKSSSDAYATNIYSSTGTTTSQSALTANTQYTYRIYGVNGDGAESTTYASVSRYTLSNAPVLDTPTTPTNDNTPLITNAGTPDATIANSQINLYDNGVKVGQTKANGSGVFNFGNNPLVNPSMEIDANSNGMADNWSLWQNTLPVAPTYTISTDSYAGLKSQRIQMSGGTATNGLGHVLYQQTSNDSFAPGQAATFTMYLKGTTTGASVQLQLDARTNGGAWIASAQSGALTLTGSWQKFTLTYPNLPATTQAVMGIINVFNYNTGNSLDFYADNAKIANYSSTLADGNHTNLTARAVNAEAVESLDSAAKTILIDTVAPVAGSVYDGTSGDQDWNNGSLNVLESNWTGFSDASSGLQKYEYAIRRQSDGFYWNTGTLVWENNNADWYSNALLTTKSVTPVYLQTSVNYYYSVRATDNAGNFTVVSSNGQQVLPTFSFSLSTNTLNFANLGSGNGYTDSQNVTVTTSTNANGGYSTYAYMPSPLTCLAFPTNTIAGYASSWTTPTTWSGYGFGYTTTDATIAGSTGFSGSKYANYNAGAPWSVVADNTSVVNGQTGAITNEQFTITNKVAVPNTQKSLKYTGIVYYISTANY